MYSKSKSKSKSKGSSELALLCILRTSERGELAVRTLSEYILFHAA